MNWKKLFSWFWRRKPDRKQQVPRPEPIVSDYRGGGGPVIEHKLVQWVGADGKTRSAYVHPDKQVGDERWWEGKAK